MQRLEIDHMMRVFRDGLVAMVPIFERAHLPWREPDANDSWYAFSEALFWGIVCTCAENTPDHALLHPLPKYGFYSINYSNHSFIAAADRPRAAFVDYDTEDSPFDICTFATIDEHNTIKDYFTRPVDQVRFVLVGHEKSGAVRPPAEALDVD